MTDIENAVASYCNGMTEEQKLLFTQKYSAARKETGIYYLLWFFLGVIGVHKFYLGKVGLGVAYIFTAAFFGIGWLVDLFNGANEVRKYNEDAAMKIKAMIK